MVEMVSRVGVSLAVGAAIKAHRKGRSLAFPQRRHIKAPPAGPKARMQYIRLREKGER